jgi:Beta-lactamase
MDEPARFEARSGGKTEAGTRGKVRPYPRRQFRPVVLICPGPGQSRSPNAMMVEATLAREGGWIEYKHSPLIVFAVLVLFAMNLRAQGLPSAKPEDVGFSAERLAYIDTYLQGKVDRGDLAGIVTLVLRHGKVVHFSALGYADLPSHRKMEKDTIFRQYSITNGPKRSPLRR